MTSQNTGSDDYEVGNCKPPVEHQFKPGQSGNPGGLSASQIEKRRANRDRAFAIEEKLLGALEKDMTDNEAAILDHIRGDVLRLVHTAIERVDGKARQAIDVDNTSSDGTMSPQASQDAVLAALRAKARPE